VMLSTKKKETHKIPGYQQLTGLLGSYGTMYREQKLPDHQSINN